MVSLHGGSTSSHQICSHTSFFDIEPITGYNLHPITIPMRYQTYFSELWITSIVHQQLYHGKSCMIYWRSVETFPTLVAYENLSDVSPLNLRFFEKRSE
jgi:adenine-specific DNA glycosylase